MFNVVLILRHPRVFNVLAIYCITKNFRDKKLSRNAVQQRFAKKSFAKGRSVNRHVYVTGKKLSRYFKIRESFLSRKYGTRSFTNSTC